MRAIATVVVTYHGLFVWVLVRWPRAWNLQKRANRSRGTQEIACYVGSESAHRKAIILGRLRTFKAALYKSAHYITLHYIRACPVMSAVDTLNINKVAHTRVPSVGFRRWSRCFAVSLQVTWVINSAVGPQLPSQPLRWLLLVSLLGEQRHDGCEQFAQDCYPTASRLRFEPRPFCAWVQHANHSATKPPILNSLYSQRVSTCSLEVDKLNVNRKRATVMRPLATSIVATVIIMYNGLNVPANRQRGRARHWSQRREADRHDSGGKLMGLTGLAVMWNSRTSSDAELWSVQTTLLTADDSVSGKLPCQHHHRISTSVHQSLVGAAPA